MLKNYTSTIASANIFIKNGVIIGAAKLEIAVTVTDKAEFPLAI